MKVAVLTVDLDPVSCYFNIHGMSVNKTEDDPVYRYGIPRFMNFLKEEGVKATFFITGKDVTEKNKNLFRSLAEKGHELACHSHGHDYSFYKFSRDKMIEDIVENRELVAELSASEPVGFRAPGYNISPQVLKVLEENNFLYDASVMPSFLYHISKYMLIKMKRLRGKKSKSSVSFFGNMRKSSKPVFNFKGSSITEFPISTVMFPFGFPMLGTALICFPSWLVKLMHSRASSLDYVSMEFHGIDLCRIEDHVSFSVLSGKQPDISISLDRKITRLKETVKFYKKQGFSFKTLSSVCCDKGF